MGDSLGLDRRAIAVANRDPPSRDQLNLSHLNLTLLSSTPFPTSSTMPEPKYLNSKKVTMRYDNPGAGLEGAAEGAATLYKNEPNPASPPFVRALKNS